MRGLLPELPKKLNVEEAERARNKVQEAYTAQRQTRSAIKPLVMSQRVWLQDQQSQKWTIGGVIKSIRNNGRSYVVETESGAAYLRNRRFIKAAACRARQEVVAIRKTTAKEKTSSLKTTSVQEVMKKKVTLKKAVHFT